MNKDLTETVEYIIEFLIGDNGKDSSKYVSYGDDGKEDAQIKIRPCGLFNDNTYGTRESVPTELTERIGGDGPLLIYGTSATQFKTQGNKNIIETDADIIASTYFMLSRYEEYALRERADLRDVHGRFVGKKSLAYKNGILETAIVDRYGEELRKMLREVGINVGEPKEQLRNVYITHDLDNPKFCGSWKSMIGQALLRGESLKAVYRNHFGPITENEYFTTFPMMKKMTDGIRERTGKECNVEEIVFIKAHTGGYAYKKYDQPIYSLHEPYIRYLLDYFNKEKFSIGLHSSYQCEGTPNLMTAEKNLLEETLNMPVKKNRYHYLRTLSPDDYTELEKNGITDDYTLSYADITGYRLGTSRSVRWINPKTQKTSKHLTLHPLTLMDCTIGAQRYMNMTAEEGIEKGKILIDEAKRASGDVCILFHNSVFRDKECDYKKMLTGITDEI